MFNCKGCILSKKCWDCVIDGTAVVECPDKVSQDDIILLPTDPDARAIIKSLADKFKSGITADERED